MTDPLTLDAYIRVSQVRGREGESFISPDVQRDQIHAWAKMRGVRIAAEHVDLDQSGGKMSRPAFDEMMRRVRSGETGGVVVAKVDRFARSLVGALTALKELEERNAEFASVTEGFDTTTSAGKLTLNILLSFAQFERDRIIESWDVAMERAIGRGIHFTRSVPLGYARRLNDKGKSIGLAPDPETAPIVAELFRRRAQRASWKELAAWLNAEVPRDGDRQWTGRNVATIIENRAYLGEAFHGQHRNTDAHEAIVTIPEWHAANAVDGGPGAIQSSSALLAGIIRCAGCRYAMRRTRIKYKTAAGEARRVETYSCQRKHTGGICPAPAHVMAHTIEPVVIDHFLTWHGLTERTERTADQEELEAAERALADAEARLEAFLADDDLREIVSRDRFLADARRRQDAVDGARAAVEDARTRAHVDGSRTFVLADEWESLSTEGKAGLLRAALDSVYVKKGHAQKGDPIEERVLTRWQGEDKYERPQRGTTNYRTMPIAWPPSTAVLHLANVPEWAVRNGHPALPEELRSGIHAEAREAGAWWYLSEEEGGRSRSTPPV